MTLRLPQPLAAVVLFFFCWSLYVNLSVPAFEAPDEYYHFAVIEHLARTGSFPPRVLPDPIVDYQFPAQPWRQMAFHAPLYYQLMAGVLRLTRADTSDFAAYRLNPHAQIGVAMAADNQNFIAHRGGPMVAGVPLADSLSGTGGAVRGLRLLSVVFSCVALLAIYGFVRSAWPQQPRRTALLAVLIIVLSPQYVFLSGIISNDVLLTLLAALGLWLFAWGMQQSRGRWWLPYAAGVIGGAAALTKASGVAVVALLGGFMLVQALRARSGQALRQMVIYGLLVVAMAGGWYLNNWLELGDWTAASWVAQATGLRGGLPVTVDELRGLLWSFWGLLGWFNVALSALFYDWTLLITVAAIIGLACGLRCGVPRGRAVLMIGLAGYSLLIVGAWWQFNQLTLAAQGRLFYPLLPILAGLLALGLSRWPRGVQIGLVAGLALACATLPVWLSQAYAPRWNATEVPSDAITALLREPWEEAACIRLYLDPQPTIDDGSAYLRVWWQANCAISGYWSVFVHAVDREQQTCAAGDTSHILAQFDSMPQGGRLPLPALPSQTSAYDILRIPIPAEVTHLHVGLYDAAGTGMRAFAEVVPTVYEKVTTGKCAPELIEIPIENLVESS